MRIDSYLAKKLSISREVIKKLILNDGVSVNGSVIKKANIIISESDDIQILKEYQAVHEYDMIPTNIPLNIIYEDEFLLVINKQAGLTVHPGSGNRDNTLVNALVHYGTKLSQFGGLDRPGIVHRLDKDTSGLLIVAKNDIIHSKLSEAIKNREVKRKYLAICYGRPRFLTGEIKTFFGKDPRNHEKMKVFTEYRDGLREAITYYTIKESFDNNLHSLIEFELQTGRTHQIRVHADYIGHSIVGDMVYGKKQIPFLQHLPQKFQDIDKQLLHAYKISFVHPYTLKNMEFESDMPSSFLPFVKK